MASHCPWENDWFGLFSMRKLLAQTMTSGDSWMLRKPLQIHDCIIFSGLIGGSNIDRHTEPERANNLRAPKWRRFCKWPSSRIQIAIVTSVTVRVLKHFVLLWLNKTEYERTTKGNFFFFWTLAVSLVIDWLKLSFGTRTRTLIYHKTP